MKRTVLRLALIPIVVHLTGCVVAIGSREASSPRREVAKPSPVVIVPGNPEDSAALAEIDAIAGLSFDNGKRDGFHAVAIRPGTSPGVQVHLVNTAVRSLSFDNAKVDVLLALIANPSFSPAAKEAILRQLDHLSFDNNKTAVLHAIQNQARNP